MPLFRHWVTHSPAVLSLGHPDQSSPLQVPEQLVLKAREGAACGFGPSLESTCGCWRGQPGEHSKTGVPKELNYRLVWAFSFALGKDPDLLKNPEACSHTFLCNSTHIS